MLTKKKIHCVKITVCEYITFNKWIKPRYITAENVIKENIATYH